MGQTTMQIAEYVQQREGEYFVNSSRVTLRSVVADWKRGRTPEQIVEDFPTLLLVAVFGAITYYLEHQQDLDHHFAEVDARAAKEKAANEAAHAAFYKEMRSRVEQVRPRVQAELREHGILPEVPSSAEESETQARSSDEVPGA